jgi:hypothetical protein
MIFYSQFNILPTMYESRLLVQVMCVLSRALSYEFLTRDGEIN